MSHSTNVLDANFFPAFILNKVDHNVMSDSGSAWKKEISICSDLGDCHRLIDEIQAHMTATKWCEEDVFSIRLALEEALVNAIKHGNQYHQHKCVHVLCEISPTRFHIQITDEGCGFDLENVPDCTLEENLEKASGRGIFLMRHFMSCVTYNEKGNQVIMHKDRPTPPEG